jgi:hypothetical protein
MNLADARIAHRDLFASHLLTLSSQDKSKDFHIRILGREPSITSYPIG